MCLISSNRSSRSTRTPISFRRDPTRLRMCPERSVLTPLPLKSLVRNVSRTHVFPLLLRLYPSSLRSSEHPVSLLDKNSSITRALHSRVVRYPTGSRLSYFQTFLSKMIRRRDRRCMNILRSNVTGCPLGVRHRKNGHRSPDRRDTGTSLTKETRAMRASTFLLYCKSKPP